MTVQKQLKQFDCDVPAKDFVDFLEMARKEKYPDWTTDVLVCHPDDAKEFCDIIRRQPEFRDLPNELILSALMGRRKRPEKRKT